MTDVEQEFLELANLAKEDERLAGEKMVAFALVNESIALEERDLECVEAAKSYSVKLRHELRVKAESKLGRIRNAFFKASKMEDVQEALKINQSLLDQHSDADFSALRNPSQGLKVLAEVKSKVAELENQIRKEALEAERNKMQEAKEAAVNQETEEPLGDQGSRSRGEESESDTGSLSSAAAMESP